MKIKEEWKKGNWFTDLSVAEARAQSQGLVKKTENELKAITGSNNLKDIGQTYDIIQHDNTFSGMIARSFGVDTDTITTTDTLSDEDWDSAHEVRARTFSKSSGKTIGSLAFGEDGDFRKGHGMVFDTAEPVDEPEVWQPEEPEELVMPAEIQEPQAIEPQEEEPEVRDTEEPEEIEKPEAIKAAEDPESLTNFKYNDYQTTQFATEFYPEDKETITMTHVTANVTPVEPAVAASNTKAAYKPNVAIASPVIVVGGAAVITSIFNGDIFVERSTDLPESGMADDMDVPAVFALAAGGYANDDGIVPFEADVEEGHFEKWKAWDAWDARLEAHAA